MPQKAEKWLVFREETYLIEHAVDISTDAVAYPGHFYWGGHGIAKFNAKYAAWLQLRFKE